MRLVVVVNWQSLLESDAGFESLAASDIYIVLDCGGIAPPIAPAEPVVNGVNAIIDIAAVNASSALMSSM